MKEIVQQYLDQGKRLIKLYGKQKEPISVGWNEADDLPQNVIDMHVDVGGNFGWAIGKEHLVIDIDVKKGAKGLESWEALKQELDLPPMDYLIRSPSGGYHIYTFLQPGYEGKKFKKNHKDYPGIDFLKHGNFVVIGGCEVDDPEYGGTYDILNIDEDIEEVQCPVALLDLLSVNNISRHRKSDNGKTHKKLSKERVLEILDKIPPNEGDNYDEWMRVGMALHNWDSVEGEQLWYDWSDASGKPRADQRTNKWTRSFEEDKDNSVTIGSLIYEAKGVEFEEAQVEFDQLHSSIVRLSEREILMDVIPIIKSNVFQGYMNDILLKSIQERLGVIKGSKPSIASVRQMLKKQDDGELVVSEEKPVWCEDWYYVETHGGFYNTDSYSFYRTQGFDHINTVNVLPNENGSKTAASIYARDNAFIPVVDTMGFLPGIEDNVVTMGGKTMVNTFNPNSIPVSASKFTNEGKGAVNRVRQHIRLICGCDEYASILEQWLAHQVQNVGKKILWSPLIQGKQGVGKSYFGKLLEAVLGEVNVGVVNSEEVKNQFNGWAIDKLVNVLEELKISGYNRHQVDNALKPLISDSKIQINDKGVKQYVSHNVTNYIAFTNFKDAIPLEEGSRRWFVIFCEIESLDDIEAMTGIHKDEYFGSLFQDLFDHPQELKYWLECVEITDEFKSYAQAPETRFKKAMVEIEDSNIDGLIEVRDLIEDEIADEDSIYIGRDVLSSVELWNAFDIKHGGTFRFNERQKAKIMTALGYEKYGKQVKIDGDPKRIWCKKKVTGNDEIRQIIGLKRLN